ncbi:MAG TPA: hypothetical protein VEV81_15300 [Pyrinomonadaceae bacterium]|nr:hypothetical protein [Pyrinomonadaceae bacterium]
MKKFLVTFVLLISLAGTFVIAEGSASQTTSRTQATSALNNSPGSTFLQENGRRRRWRRWHRRQWRRQWRRHERREMRREIRRNRRHNM